MMHTRRFLVAFLFAGATAAFVFLYPRVLRDADQQNPQLLEKDLVEERGDEQSEEIVVPWPSPPSASPLTSELPPVIVEPEEPQSVLLFREINQHRTTLGLKSVTTDETLTALAQIHVSDMARRMYLEHVTPEGVSFEMRMSASGYSYILAGENLGFASHIDLIVPNWIRSPVHRDTMENETYSAIGVATILGTWQGVDVIYAATIFAAPRQFTV